MSRALSYIIDHKSLIREKISNEKLFRLASPIALYGWYLFALLGPFSTAGGNISMALLLLATVPIFPLLWRDVRQQPAFWLALWLTFYILIRSLLAIRSIPEIGEAQNPHWRDLLKMTGLLAFPLGWWLYRHPSHVPYLLATTLIGFLAGPLYAGNWEQILAASFESRWVWGYPPNYLGMASDIAILGLLAWLLLPNGTRILRRAWLAGLPALMIMSFFLYTSQSRSAWVALPLGILIILMGVLKHSLPWSKKNWAAVIALTCALSSLALLILAFDGGKLALQRVTSEWHTIETALSGNFGAAATVSDSVGWRIEMWQAGLKAAAARPVFGWGPGAGIILLRSEYANLGFSHFHNLYLELLVSLGGFGAGLAAATAFFFLRAAIHASFRLMLWPPALSVGIFAVTSCVAITLIFTLRIGQPEGRATLTVLTALFAMAAFQVAEARQKSCSEQNP